MSNDVRKAAERRVIMTPDHELRAALFEALVELADLRSAPNAFADALQRVIGEAKFFRSSRLDGIVLTDEDRAAYVDVQFLGKVRRALDAARTYGAQGPLVTTLQSALGSAEFYGPVDGKADGETDESRAVYVDIRFFYQVRQAWRSDRAHYLSELVAIDRPAHFAGRPAEEAA